MRASPPRLYKGGLKGQQLLALGNALGIVSHRCKVRPERA